MRNNHLRHWQAQCIKKALRHYKSKKHFFCQATPAAGKTLMAAVLAKRLLEQGEIDLIVCFAPTRQVVRSIRRTFERVIGRPMNGLVGAVGAAFTYPAMDHRDESFWKLFESHRVFVVFDEIHHCAGSELEAGNSWGATIVQRIQDTARFTLALSGTPWRSDAKPIVLARYSHPDGRLICDYRYGLREAVEQGVCRMPKIVLLDNESIEVREQHKRSEGAQIYQGIEELLDGSDVTYDRLLRNEELVIKLIKMGIAKLDSIRRRDATAGGLIVTTNIEHANTIALLLQDLGESYCVVTNQTPNAQDRIEEFRGSNCRWIVAVGMVSEGTDIQRLQVCCYLSRIRTELHFRQVLGRVLRRQCARDEFAWLFALAEPSVREFALRIAEDLPEEHVVVTHEISGELKDVIGRPFEKDKGLFESGEPSVVEMGAEDSSYECGSASKTKSYSLSFSDSYKHKILSFY